MNFYELDKNLKVCKKEQAKRFSRGAAGVVYSNFVHMLDPGQYIKLAWDTISDATIKNAFNNAKLVTLKGGAHEEIDMMADLLCSLKALNILIDESTLDKFGYVDDKHSEDFSHEMWDGVSELLKSMQATNNNENENESCAHSQH